MLSSGIQKATARLARSRASRVPTLLQCFERIDQSVGAEADMRLHELKR